MDNLHFDKLEIQPYLSSSNIYPQLAKKIFMWRTRMTNFKCNFRNGNNDLSCVLGCKDIDSQERVLKCPQIILHLPDIDITTIKYADIFSNNVSTVKSAGELLQKALKIREELIEKQKQD